MREPGTTTWPPLLCTFLGSAVVVPGSMGANVLANCGPETVIEELDEGDGNATRDPLLYVALDHSGVKDYCSDATELDASDINWYRAWPLLKLGDF